MTPGEQAMSVIGKKAENLLKLKSMGLAVPAFIVLPYDLLQTAAEENGIDLKRKGVTRETILRMRISKAVEQKILAAAKDLAPPFAVRSSSEIEDGSAKSGAGQFKTVLNVGRENLPNAVREVWASAFSESAASYSKSVLGGMGVIVQTMQRGEFSGVGFSVNPVSFNRGECVIEAAEGCCDGLVSGAVTPETYRLDRHRDEVEPRDERYKTIRSVFDGLIKIEREFGCPVDIEWTADRGEARFLQARPMTAIDLPAADFLTQLYRRIGERQFEFYVRRDFAYLALDAQIAATDARLQQSVYGFSVECTPYVWVNGSEFYAAEGGKIARQKWKKIYESSQNALEDFYERVVENCEITEARAEKIARLNLQSYSLSALKELFEAVFRQYTISYLALMMRPDDFLEEELNAALAEENACVPPSFLGDLCSRTCIASYYETEQLSLLNCLGRGRESIERHRKKFGFLKGALSPGGGEFTALDYEGRLAKIEDIDAERELLSRRKAEREARYFSALARLKKGGAAYKLAVLVNKFFSLRTYAAAISDRFFSVMRNTVLRELAGRMNIDREDILTMSPDEILAGGVSAEKIERRREGRLIMDFGGGAERRFGKCARAAEYEMGRRFKKAVFEDGVLLGQTACGGCVRGKIKIVSGFSDCEKVEKGDIVVTGMLTPEIVSVAKLAAGVVTDEGGFTCHAAIIAREYDLPCVVGTVNATGSFKDGMTVTLDATNGRVIREEEA